MTREQRARAEIRKVEYDWMTFDQRNVIYQAIVNGGGVRHEYGHVPAAMDTYAMRDAMAAGLVKAGEMQAGEPWHVRMAHAVRRYLTRQAGQPDHEAGVWYTR